MSFLTAALYGLGAFGQGRQQRQNYQLEQQRQADTHAYEQAQTQAEQARVAQEQATGNRAQIAQVAALRAKGLSPTGEPLPPLAIHLPPNLQRVVPGKVGPNYAVTNQDLINHQISMLRFQANQYRAAGRSDYADSLDATADGLQKQVMADIAQADRDREQSLRELAQNQRTADIIAGANSRNALTTSTSAANNANTVSGAFDRTAVQQGGATGRTLLTINAANARNSANVAQRYTAQSDNDLRSMEHANALATTQGKPTPYPNLDTFKTGLASAISQVTADPKQLAAALKAIDAHSNEFGPQLLIYARRQLQDAAREAQGAVKNVQPGMTVPQDNAPSGLGPPSPLP